MMSFSCARKINKLIKRAENAKNPDVFQKIKNFFRKKHTELLRKRTFENINKLTLSEKFHSMQIQWRLKILYKKNQLRISQEAKIRKIKVVFLVNDTSKWHSDTLYNILSTCPYFDPQILITKAEHLSDSYFLETFEFFKKQYANVESAYDIQTKSYINLKKFSPDIVFYQQPWDIPPEHSIYNTSKFALICYTPYCFHLLVSEYDYLEKFHRFLWKYFVESKEHAESYKSRFRAKNCVSVGSLHLDKYLIPSRAKIKIWRNISPNLKRIIYAPHFSFGVTHNTATFSWNGKFMLNLASMHPQTTWLVKPHPTFDSCTIEEGIMTSSELQNYYKEWEKYGAVFRGGGYFDAFEDSDCLITDSISFLADYLPTGKPVFHLRSTSQAVEFNDFAKNFITTYYQIHDNAELYRLFSKVVIDGDDFLKEQRISKIKGVLPANPAGQLVVDHLRNAFGI